MLMNKIHTLPVDGLLDLLSIHTAKYTHLLAARELDSRKFKHSKSMIKNLQKEIESRKKPGETQPHVDMSTGDIY